MVIEGCAEIAAPIDALLVALIVHRFEPEGLAGQTFARV